MSDSRPIDGTSVPSAPASAPASETRRGTGRGETPFGNPWFGPGWGPRMVGSVILLQAALMMVSASSRVVTDPSLSKAFVLSLVLGAGLLAGWQRGIQWTAMGGTFVGILALWATIAFRTAEFGLLPFLFGLACTTLLFGRPGQRRLCAGGAILVLYLLLSVLEAT